MDGGEIGVITPLRQQQNLIREKLLQDNHSTCTSSSFNLTICAEAVREDQAVRGRDEAAGHGSSHGDVTNASCSCSAGVEVNTVDKYQGRDKECIVVSCTRSNSKGNVSTIILCGHTTPMCSSQRIVMALYMTLYKQWLCLLQGSFTIGVY